MTKVTCLHCKRKFEEMIDPMYCQECFDDNSREIIKKLQEALSRETKQNEARRLAYIELEKENEYNAKRVLELQAKLTL